MEATVRAVLTTLALVLTGLVVSPPVSAQEEGSTTDPNGDGLHYIGATTFRPDPDRGVVAVTAELDLRNVRPDERTADGVLQYFFPGVILPVLDSARDLRARSNGADLDVSIIEEEGATDAAEVTFPSSLRFGQERRVVVSYEVPSAAARSEEVTRINPAYVAFPAFAVGDRGLASVTVELPAGYQPDVVGSDPEFGAGDGPVFTARNIDEPETWWSIVTAQDDDRLDELLVEEEGRSFHIRSWPGDDEWAAFVADYAGAPLDEMAGLVGEPWTDGEPYDIVEAYSPYLYGYSGWFEPVARRIVIGEDLDPSVVLHELAHGWFNGNHISERWINEGLANEFADQTLKALGEDGEVVLLSPDEIRFPLATWEDALADAAGDEFAAVEEYGYERSWYVIHAIVADIGLNRMQAVLDAVFDRAPAYAGDRAEFLPSATVDDRRFLDLLERVGGSETASVLLERYVMAETDVELLDERAAAVTRYDELAAAGGEWAVPLGIRRAMEAWNFSRADQGIDAALIVLGQRQELIDLVEGLDLALPASLETVYEDARLPLDGVADRLAAQTAAARDIRRITDASTGVDGLIARIGLLGTALDPIVDEARAAFEAGDLNRAGERVAAFDEANRDAEAEGWARIGAAALVSGALVGISLLATRHRRSRANPLHDLGRPNDESADAAEAEDVVTPPVPYDPSATHPRPLPDANLPRREPSAGP